MTTTTIPFLFGPPLSPAAKRFTAQRPARWPIAMLGVAFDAVTMRGALARIEDMIASGRPHYVVTPNVDFLVQARRDAELRHILLDAHLVLCDGTPLVWASRWLGNRLPERVAGADLAPHLIALAEKKRYRLFLLGATPQANAQAVTRLRASHPALQLAGAYSPPFKPLHEMDHDDIARRIRAARPDILFVSFGCPKQEKWIAQHYQSLGVPVVIGVGAVIDFLAGHMRRAPRWMQVSGTEWLYRLAQEPRRLFRRYLDDLRSFGGALLAQCWQFRWRASVAARGWVVWAHAEPRCFHVKITGRLDHGAIVHAAGLWEHIRTDHYDCVFNLSEVHSIDSTGVGLLVKLHNELRETGRRLALLSPSAAVQRAFAAMQLADFFTVTTSPPPGWRHDDSDRQAA